VIGFRVTSVKKCFIMKMVKETTLSLSNIASGIQHFTHLGLCQTQPQISPPAEGSSANSAPPPACFLQLADRTALGTSLNLLCSDIPIYWAE
ncbi:unnamed protein product, partial [Eretmochelys imbricata]